MFNRSAGYRIQYELDNLRLSPHLASDGVEPPNGGAHWTAWDILDDVLKRFNLIHTRMDACRDEGIMIRWMNLDAKNELQISVLNDGVIDFVAEKDGEIVATVVTDSWEDILPTFQKYVKLMGEQDV